MMNRHLRAVATLVVALAVLLVACAPEATEEPTRRPTNTPVPPTEAPAEEVTEEVTEIVTEEADAEATEEADAEATEEADAEATEEADAEATEEADAEATEEADAEATEEAEASQIEIDTTESFVRAAFAGNSAAYMSITNNGDEDVTLVGGSTDAAESVEIHETVVEDDVASMVEMEDGIVVAAGETVVLEPGGLHVMLIDITDELEEGDTVELTLSFDNDEELTVEIPVQVSEMETDMGNDEPIDMATEEAEDIATEEADAMATEEAEDMATEEADAETTEEAEDMATEEAEDMATEEAEDMATEEAEDMATEEAEDMATEEAEDMATEEANAMATEEPMDMATEEADAMATEEAEDMGDMDVEFESYTQETDTYMLSFDYPATFTLTESQTTDVFSLNNEDERIVVVGPNAFGNVAEDTEDLAEALNFYLTRTGYTVGEETSMMMGDASYNITFPRRGQEGAATLVTVGEGLYAVVIELTPDYAASNIGALGAEIMDSLEYTVIEPEEPAEMDTDAGEAETEATEEAEAESTEEAEAEATEEAESTDESTDEASEETEAAEEQTLTIGGLAINNPDLSTLANAVVRAELFSTLNDSDAELTVFAPTNEAFNAALEELGLEFDDLVADQELLTSVLTYHVVEGTVTSDMLESGEVETLNGESITVEIAEDGTVTVNGATVVTADVEASNGVVHVIDAVLLPPSGEEEEEE